MIIPEVFRVEVENSARNLSQLFEYFAKQGLNVAGMQTISKCQKRTLWELTLEIEEERIDDILSKIEELSYVNIVGKSDRVFSRHIGGKIETISKAPIESQEELRDIYTPGVARVCLAIQKKPKLANLYTAINKRVAIVTNGTAILGLGDIGPVAGMPVMEGKAALFNRLVGLSGVPILLEEKDPSKIVEAVACIAPSFGAIQLEDIKAPECFDIETELIERLDIPVLHDDQHGTAVVALAALLSATKSVKKSLKDSVVGQIGLGAAGIGISRLLIGYGVKQMIGTDLNEGALKRLESHGGHRAKNLPDLMERADIVVATTGVKGLIKPEWIKPGHLILALTNPEPEIEPEVALERGACFAADGKSVNNVLGFPGIFKGALDGGAKRFTQKMLIAAAQAIHEQAPKGQLVPDPLIHEVHEKVAQAIIENI
jgi:malate dehydrogenase (oxaloacetate-decarboxylating)